MRSWVGSAVACCLLAACTANIKVAAKTPPATRSVANASLGTASPALESSSPAASPAASPRATESPSLAPSVAPTPALPKSRLDALLAALQDSVGASRASRMAPGIGYTSGLLSDMGASLISNNGGSLISDNGGGLISDNGGGIISDNGGSLISNNGGSLTSKTKWHVLDTSASTAASPAPTPTPVPYPHDSDVASGTTYYHIHLETQDTGYVKTYDLAKYKADPRGTEAAGPIDWFTWDSVGVQFPDLSQGLIDLVVPLHKVKSARLPFVDDMISTSHRQYGVGDNIATSDVFKMLGLELEYDMNIPLLGGSTDKVHIKAVCVGPDMVVQAGSDGYPQSVPKRFKLTGTNSDGTYDGESLYDGPITTRVTHTTKSGVVTDVELTSNADGTFNTAVTSHAASMRLELKATADGTATGQVLDGLATGGTVLGTASVSADGIATLTFTSGGTLQARVF